MSLPQKLCAVIVPILALTAATVWWQKSKQQSPAVDGLLARATNGTASAITSPHDDVPVVDTTANVGDAGGALFEIKSGPASGLEFQYFNDEQLDRMFGAETNGGGLGWIDFDGNGFPDLYIVNGCRLPYAATNFDHLDALHVNRGDGLFFDAAALAGIQENEFGQGVAVGDIDNDGWDDIYVCNFGTNRLYRNCGDGTFLHVTANANDTASIWSAGAAFGDIDRDGDLDLYVTVYAEADLSDPPVCYDSATGTKRVYCGPDRYRSTSHFLFANDGAGALSDVTVSSGCDKSNGKGMGVVIVDLDHDLWPEIFVANDMTPSFLYHNVRRESGAAAHFEETGIESGVAFNGNGRLMAGMGIACGDADGDGWLDLYVSHYHRQGNTFYRNQRRLSFRDHTAAMSLLVPSLPYLGFGCEFVDYDNDGWLDLYVSNGHVLGPHYPDWKMKPQLFRNLNGERFAEVSGSAGPYFQGQYLGRGSAAADYDNDGAVDFAVSHLDQPVVLLHNMVSSRGNSLGFRCVGAESNRDGVNVAITLHLGDRTLTRQVIGGGSYQSAPDYRGLVGIGDRASVDRIELNWPSGKHEVWNDIPAGGLYLLSEGDSPRKLMTWENQADVHDR